jgi:hypothetical protein
MQGEVTEAAKALGLQLRDQNGKIKTQSQLMDELITLYGGFSETNKDAQADLDTFAATIARLKRDIGEGLAPAIGVATTALFYLIATLKSVGTVVGGVVSQAIGMFTDLGSVIKAAFDLKKLVADPSEYFATVAEAAARGYRNMSDSDELFWDQIVENYTRASDEIIEGEKGKEAVFAVTRAKEAELAAKAAEKKREREAKEAAKAAEERAEIERDAADALLAQQISSSEEGSAKRLKLELDMLDRLKDRALEEAEGVEEAKAAIEETFRLAKQEREREHREQSAEEEIEAKAELEQQLFELEQTIREEMKDLYADDREKTLELEMEDLEARKKREIKAAGNNVKLLFKIYKKYAIAKIKLEAAAAESEAEIERKKQQAKIQMGFQYAQGAVELGRAVFGNNKAIAIAETIINTASSVMEAAPNIPLMALMAAIGAAQIATILTTEPGFGAGSFQFEKIGESFGGAMESGRAAKTGEGFDDPVHDRLARLGGRRWAEDLVENVGVGFTQRLDQLAPEAFPGGGPGGDVTNLDQSTTTHEGDEIHIHGGVFARRQDMKRLIRMIDKARGREDARRYR